MAALSVGCGGSAFTTSGGDAGPASDGSAVEGGDGGADACASFCAAKTGLTSCSDFDEQPAGQAPTGWAEAATQGGSVQISTAEAVSCSTSLAVSLPAASHLGGTAGVSMTVAAKGTAPRIVVDLAVFLPTADTMSSATYFALAAGLEGAVGLTHHGDPDWYLSNKDFSINVPLDPAPLVGAWNQMNLDVQYSLTSGSVKLSYVGTDMTTHVPTFNGKTATLVPQNVTVSLGISAPGQTEAPFTAYFDDVEIKSE